MHCCIPAGRIRIGNTVANKNSRLAAVFKGVVRLNFGDFHGNQIDLFGDACEFLISNYAANAGKSGDEKIDADAVVVEIEGTKIEGAEIEGAAA